MRYKLILIVGVLGTSIGASGIVLVILGIAFLHNESIDPIGILEILILLTCCILGLVNSLIGFIAGEKKSFSIFFIPLILPLMTLLTGEMEPKVGALVHVSLIESIFVWIAGSIGMHLKRYSANEQTQLEDGKKNEITKETNFN